MKAFIPFTALLLIAAAGCGSAPPRTSEQIKADNPAKAALTEKLDKMTPEERAAYVQSNQAEIQQTYSGVNSSQPASQ